MTSAGDPPLGASESFGIDSPQHRSTQCRIEPTLGLADMIAAGINDWGGVSPVTPDHVNPEAPWPALATLTERTAEAGKFLVERLAIYPRYIRAAEHWLDPALRSQVLRAVDAEGFARADAWIAGAEHAPPDLILRSRAEHGVSKDGRNAWTRRHPSRRAHPSPSAQERAPQDEGKARSLAV